MVRVPPDAKGPAMNKATSFEKASSVPGRRQTAVLGSSGAANPRVPVPKFRVVILSPTLAGRDRADCKLKSHMPRHSSVEAPGRPDRIKQYATTGMVSVRRSFRLGLACRGPFGYSDFRYYNLWALQCALF